MLKKIYYSFAILFTRFMVAGSFVDAYLASNRGDYLQAARHESIAHEWERRLHGLLINKRYRYVR